MAQSDERRFSIGEVSEAVGVPVQMLRRWENEFPQLKPKRNRANRRYYLQADMDIARRIKVLLQHEKMRPAGARIRLAQELHGEGRPRSTREAVELVDKIEDEARAMLDLLDSDT